MEQIAVQMFSSSPFPVFLFIYLFVLPCFRVRRAKETTMWWGQEQWQAFWHHALPLYLSLHAFTNLHIALHCFYSVFHQNIGVYSLSMALYKTYLPYFTFYFTLYCSWTHHSSHSRASCFLSREWQIAPSGSHSLWSPLHVAATIIPCTTFKHIPFALQFVQPGIITTPLNPHYPHIATSLWVSPIPGLFCHLQGSILCFLCPVCFYSGKGAKCQSMNRIWPHRNP